MSKFAPPEELEVSKDALDSHISATATGTLFTKRTGMIMEWHQLQYLKKKKKNDLVMEARESLGSGHEITAVDRLIADLENDPKTMNEQSDLVQGAKAKKELREERESKFTGGKRGLEEYKAILRNVMKYVIPRYERTRTVKIIAGNSPNEKIIVCDCWTMVKWGFACRHIYRIMKRRR